MPFFEFSSQTCPSHGCPALGRKVSYGEISAKEVDAIIAQSDVDDAELSAASLHHHGCVLFVDNEASEASQHSDDLSADDKAVAMDCESDIRSSSSMEVIHIVTPIALDNESAGGESVAQADSLEALEEVQPSCPHQSKTKMAKGAHIDKLSILLTTGNSKDIATDDDLKRDLTTWKPFERRSSHSMKKEVLSSNAHLEEELSINPVTDTLTKTMTMSKAKAPLSAPKDVPNENKSDCKAPIANRSSCTSATVSSVPSPIKCTLSKSTRKVNAPVTISTTSGKQTSSRKSATKALASVVEKKAEPLFLPSDSGLSLPFFGFGDMLTYYVDGTGSAPPPDLHAQLSADLAALLGTQRDASTTDPEDPALCTMQPALMEDHLITLGVYESLPAPGSLVEAFKFGSYRAFVSLACVPHSLLSFEKRSLHFSGSNVVCMMAGLITECMFGASNCCADTSSQSSPTKGHQGSPMKKLLPTLALGPGGSVPKKDKLEVLSFLK
ncbi:hypothetical protein EDD18DRAFT_1100961 [Armillaria luteobubalina]|uniref:Uncharacterized protein n=1 Tax=Armillaria luteobubalina TaxID=153913 RepID=A0AA39QGL7_9AGAR|nr:hypothetical protein EDD18DRAFT_1100961 [Armillaria luteobubalina]